MCSPSRVEQTTAANIGNMMGRLGIDTAYAALPRYGLAFSSALRACLHVNNALSGWQIPATPRLARRNSAQVLIYCGSFFAIPRLVIAHNRSNYERVRPAAGRAGTCHGGPNSPSA